MNLHEDVANKIRDAERHFKDHVAIHKAIADCKISILDWREPNSPHYAMRVVFDNERGSRVYISGDLGEAVIYPTCPATLDNFVNCFTMRTKEGFIDLREGYFLEKVKTSSDRYCWSREDFVEDFIARVERYQVDGEFHGLDIYEFLEDHVGYNGGVFEPFYEGGIEIDSDTGIKIDEDVKCVLTEADCDYWEWFYDCGKRINPRIILWLVGVRLAWEQLRNMKFQPEVCLGKGVK